MIGLGLTVPIACWRKGAARELLETEDIPPPATCYGALLSFVGEVDRERHRGCRVSVGLLQREGYRPGRSSVLRTIWRIKSKKMPQGKKQNARPDYQQLIIDARLLVLCDSSDEPDPQAGLEQRVVRAFKNPSAIERFGGWSLGESTHLINDAWLFESYPVDPYQLYLLAPQGDLSLPVWVDHVGSAGTRYALGHLEPAAAFPPRDRLPQIPFPEQAPAGQEKPRAGRKKS